MEATSKLLNVYQMAEKLNVPASTVYFWVGRKQVPFLKVGRHLRFDPEEVFAFFNRTSRLRSPESIKTVIQRQLKLIQNVRN